MNKELTYIAVVLDRSGSMSGVQKATKEGLDAFIAQQKKTPGQARLTLVQFDNEYEIHAWEKPLSEVAYEYVPRGGTALLDAIGKTVTDVGASLAARPESARPGKVLFVIVTDGEENSSRTYTREKIFEMISHQRETYSWEFIFLGANQDGIQAGTSLGISAASSMTYASTPIGTAAAFDLASESTRSYRGGMTANAGFSNLQRKGYAAQTGSAASAAPVDDSTVAPPVTPVDPNAGTTP